MVIQGANQPAMRALMDNIRPLRRPIGRHAAFERRWKTRREAEVRVADARTPCVVVDMSVNGAGLSIGEPPVEGSVVSLILSDRRPIEARVVWRRVGAVGLCFLQRQPWVVDLVAKSASA
jgi:hypothetical protein